jgi:rhodanese-related sulfurtransferase
MVPSAIHIPLAAVSDVLRLQPAEFLEKCGVEKPQLDDEVVFYCRSGRRSTLASDVAKEQGYTK